MKTFTLGLAVAAAVASLSASAVPNPLTEGIQQNASGTCNGALPFFDQQLRFRPLAVKNEGTTNAFVTCTQLNKLSNDVEQAIVYLHNTGTATVTVNCTLVDGRDSFGNQAYPKSVQLFAGAQGMITWNNGDTFFGANFRDLINFSCNLPIATELEFIGIRPRSLTI